VQCDRSCISVKCAQHIHCICNCEYTIGPSSDLGYSFYNDFKLQMGHIWPTSCQCSVFILLFVFCWLLSHCTMFYCCCCWSFESQMVKTQSSSMISFFLRSKKNYSVRPFAVAEKVSCQLIFNFYPHNILHSAVFSSCGVRLSILKLFDPLIAHHSSFVTPCIGTQFQGEPIQPGR